MFKDINGYLQADSVEEINENIEFFEQQMNSTALPTVEEIVNLLVKEGLTEVGTTEEVEKEFDFYSDIIEGIVLQINSEFIRDYIREYTLRSKQAMLTLAS